MGQTCCSSNQNVIVSEIVPSIVQTEHFEKISTIQGTEFDDDEPKTRKLTNNSPAKNMSRKCYGYQESEKVNGCDQEETLQKEIEVLDNFLTKKSVRFSLNHQTIKKIDSSQPIYNEKFLKNKQTKQELLCQISSTLSTLNTMASIISHNQLVLSLKVDKYLPGFQGDYQERLMTITGQQIIFHGGSLSIDKIQLIINILDIKSVQKLPNDYNVTHHSDLLELILDESPERQSIMSNTSTMMTPPRYVPDIMNISCESNVSIRSPLNRFKHEWSRREAEWGTQKVVIGFKDKAGKWAVKSILERLISYTKVLIDE